MSDGGTDGNFRIGEEDPESMQIFLHSAELIAAFKKWVYSHPNWQLSPPMRLSDEPDEIPTYFIQPTQEAWDSHGR